MANPQLENGYTQIANELIEALARTSLSSYQGRILWAIIRKTYGFKKKADWVSNSQLQELTGISKGHVSRTKKELLMRNIIVTNSGNKIALNKDWSAWRRLPIGVRGYQFGQKVTNSGKKVTNSGGHKRNYTKEKEQKKRERLPIRVTLPDWLPKETWQDFVEHRKKTKAALSNKAAELAIGKLQKLRDAGNDPKAVIEQSILNGWKGLFELKDGNKKQPQSIYR